MNFVKRSYEILESLRLPHGLYVASPSTDYAYVWLRDSFYEVLPYLHSDCARYEQTYHRILDLFKQYEAKIDRCIEHKPTKPNDYFHIRFEATKVEEIDKPWGHCQHDAIGAVLFGISEGVRVGKQIIRDDRDMIVLEKMVRYLATCRYWMDADNGMWEEWREVRSSSVGACVAGLMGLRTQELVAVPEWLIAKGLHTLENHFPLESADRPVDLAQLSLIYPFRIFNGEEAKTIIRQVEKFLLKERGVKRYLGDSYYSTAKDNDRSRPLHEYYGHEAEWTMGLCFLSLCYQRLGNIEMAQKYIEKTESVMLEDGSLPELYFAETDLFGPNTPLGWSNAMYILAKENRGVE